MSVTTKVSRTRFFNLMRNCRGVRLRVDRTLPGGAVQTWMRTVYLSRNVTHNRQIIANGIQDLRRSIRATAILA